MGSFSDSVNKNINTMLAAVDKKCYAIVYDLFNRIIQTTPSPAHPGPFATGLLANQWYPSVGNTFSSALSSATNPMGNDSVIRVAAMLAGNKQFFGKDGVMTLTNNVPHAHTAETIGWGAKTPPYRMVFTALQKIASENK